MCRATDITVMMVLGLIEIAENRHAHNIINVTSHICSCSCFAYGIFSAYEEVGKFIEAMLTGSQTQKAHIGGVWGVGEGMLTVTPSPLLS